MANITYRCFTCSAHVFMIHKIGETKKIICPKCKTKMFVELQAIRYDIDNKDLGENNNG